MDRWIGLGKVAVVTGASSGIGAATAKKLAEAGLTVVGLARRADQIENISRELKAIKAKGHLLARKTDLSDTKQITDTFKWIKDYIGVVNILINCAGSLPRSTLSTGNPEDWKRIIDVNLLGTAVCTKEAITQMKEHQVDGHIVNINSVAGHWPLKIPDLSIYPATKYGITAMTDCLRYELFSGGSKIKVSSVSPGAVDTDMLNTAVTSLSSTSKEDFPKLKPENLADTILYVVATPPDVYIQELIVRPTGETL